MKTFSAKPETVKRDWFVVDATDKVLGRLAAEVSRRLRGKHKPEFTPHVDTGDYIVVVNVEKLRVTGAKAMDKKYYRHSTYPGGIYETNFTKLQARHPDRILKLAVKGMLPKNPLGRAMFRKLKVYRGAEHPHTAQQPKALEI
jgi:large subunit ribosomal protein L13